MTQLNLNLPVIGQTNATEDPKVRTALSDIQTVVNALDNTNIASAADINGSKLLDSSIATAKLANDAVTADKIAANAVGSSEIAADAVGTSEIASGAVTSAKLASPILLGFHSLSTAQTTTSTHNDYQAEGLTKSITYAANRILRITLIVNPYPSGGSQGIIYRLRRGNTTLTSFQILPEEFNTNNATARTYTHIFNGPATGGTETFSVEFRASSNNTAVTSYAGDQGTGGTWYRQLIVEDLGPQ